MVSSGHGKIVRWTPEDDEALRRMAAQGVTRAAAAERLGRSLQAVRNRAPKVGASFAQTETARAPKGRRRCLTCFYHSYMSGMHCCDYFDITGERRDCDIGDACLRYDPRKRPRRFMEGKFRRFEAEE